MKLFALLLKLRSEGLEALIKVSPQSPQSLEFFVNKDDVNVLSSEKFLLALITVQLTSVRVHVLIRLLVLTTLSVMLYFSAQIK